MRCCRSIAAPGRSGPSTARSRRRSSGCSSIPSSCSASSAIRRMSRPGRSYRVNDLALASRLSFFLWSSVPDDELLQLAEKGKLKEPAIFEQQVRRMIADQRSTTLVTNFAAQWLFLRNVKLAKPDSYTSRIGTTTCAPRWSPRPSSSSTIRFARTTGSPNCSRPVTASSTNGWPSTTTSRACTAVISAAWSSATRIAAAACSGTAASCWSRRSRTVRRRSCAASGCSRTSSTTRRRRRRRTCPTCRRL